MGLYSSSGTDSETDSDTGLDTETETGEDTGLDTETETDEDEDTDTETKTAPVAGTTMNRIRSHREMCRIEIVTKLNYCLSILQAELRRGPRANTTEVLSLDYGIKFLQKEVRGRKKELEKYGSDEDDREMNR
ncbi:hypothetical protein [Caudoviricetes sp.]|nr:hypothetical protein [Caudoviricetes sp.]